MTRIEETPPVQIQVRVGDEIHTRNLSDDLRVDEEHINEYLTRAPGLTAYYNMLYEKQRSIVTRNKVALERLYATLDAQYRKQKRDDDQKPVNAEIENLVKLNDDYCTLEDQLVENQETLNLLKAAVESIKEMRSTLISLSANMRSSGSIRVALKEKEEIFKKRFGGN